MFAGVRLAADDVAPTNHRDSTCHASDTSTPRVDVHLTADDLRAALRLDADRGLRADAEGHPAQVVLRHSRLAALRRHHPAARVLPDALRTGDPRGARATRSPPSPAPTRSWSSAPGPRRRRASCSTRCATPARSRRFVPFDVSEQTLRDAAAAVGPRLPGRRRARRRRRLRASPRDDPRRRAAAGRVPRRDDRQPRAAGPGRASCARSRRASAPTTTCCSASTS